ncbi:MAG: UDPGP type 1 family protein [Planctomycetes bacterium]|nr:UDPGP type 1 family protein [Planctomycetota bacterium]
MAETHDLDSRYRRVLAELKPRHQEHVLRWWNELTPPQRNQLLGEIEEIPWNILDPLIPQLVLARPAKSVPGKLEPAPVFHQKPAPGQETQYRKAARVGQELIRTGKVAALTVAGGQGTRLGVDGPKGAVVVTPLGHRTLFELFAESVKAARARYDAVIPWYIMTSPANHDQTVDFFETHNHFGLPPDDVVLFAQGMLPAFDPTGHILLQSKHGLALAPDGHGGTLNALARSGALADMQSRGVEIISYFQVDNPLVKAFDPVSLGLHATTGAEMSTKVTPKVDDVERVGNVCVADGKVTIIEYTDLPDELAHARNPDGSRKFNSGNLAIHLFSMTLANRVVGESFRLPFRRADKAVPFVDERGQLVIPQQPNAVKLESFIFDVLPLAGNPLVLEVERAEEFSPVKNATGVDSLETSQRDQVRRACRWLEQAGVDVPRKPDGEPAVTVVILPSFALDAADVRAKKDRLPMLEPGDSVVLE